MIAVFCVSVSSCNKQPSGSDAEFSQSKYSVARVGVTDADVFTDNTTVIYNGIEEYIDSTADDIKQIEINGETIELKYKNTEGSIYRNVHVYEDHEGKVSGRYYVENDALAQIAAYDKIPFPAESVDAEPEYIDWAKSLLSSYGVNDLDTYEYSCETCILDSGISSSGKGYASNNPFDYFCLPSGSNESLSSYKFRFAKYVGDYKTSDSVSVYIGFRTGLIIVQFNNDEFSSMDELQIDRAEVENSLDQYIKDSINYDNCSLHSYSITDEVLRFIDGKLCCVYTVSIKLLKNNTYISSYMSDYAVFLE